MGKQIPLAFNPMAIPERKSVLYMAYGRLELSRHLSFEQVMANRVIAIGVRNMADAITRRGCSGKSSMTNPSSDAMSKYADPGTEDRSEGDRSGLKSGAQSCFENSISPGACIPVLLSRA